MNKQNKFFVFKCFTSLAICFFVSANVFAANSVKENYSIVVKNLSKKLQNDLADQTVTVKLMNVEQYTISKNQIGIKGEGVCVSSAQNNQLPIKFDAKFDAAKQIVSDIKYDFVEYSAAAPEFSPTSTEEFLMKELMKQISKDYKTDNIVIAIDDFEDVSKLSDKRKYTGIGEIRIGSFVWNKIKFDVTLENQAASKVVYEVGK